MLIPSQFVNEMENFHSVRNAHDQIKLDKRNRYLIKTSSPDSFSYNFISSTAPPLPLSPITAISPTPTRKRPIPAPTLYQHFFPTPRPYYASTPIPRPIVTPRASPRTRQYVNVGEVSSARPLLIANRVTTQRPSSYFYPSPTPPATRLPKTVKHTYSTRRSTTTPRPQPSTTAATTSPRPSPTTPHPEVTSSHYHHPHYNSQHHLHHVNPAYIRQIHTTPRSFFIQQSWQQQQQQSPSPTYPSPLPPTRRPKPSPSPHFVSSYRQRQKEFALLSNEIDDDKDFGFDFGRIAKKQVRNYLI